MQKREDQSMQDRPASRTPSTTETQAKSPAVSPIEQERSCAQKDYTAMIGWILRGGATLSAAVILIGLLLLPLHPEELSERSLQVFPHTLDQVWMGLLVLQPQAVIALGLLLLLATPVAAVTTAAVTFALERDYRYVVISLIVLAILITSFLIGKGGG